MLRPALERWARLLKHEAPQGLGPAVFYLTGWDWADLKEPVACQVLGHHTSTWYPYMVSVKISRPVTALLGVPRTEAYVGSYDRLLLAPHDKPMDRLEHGPFPHEVGIILPASAEVLSLSKLLPANFCSYDIGVVYSSIEQSIQERAFPGKAPKNPG